MSDPVWSMQYYARSVRKEAQALRAEAAELATRAKTLRKQAISLLAIASLIEKQAEILKDKAHEDREAAS